MPVRKRTRAPARRRHHAAGLSLGYHRLLKKYHRGGLLAPAGGLLAPAGGAMHRRKTRARSHRKRGGFLPFLPLIAAAIPAILGGVSGAMDIAERAKRIKALNEAKAGSGIRRRKVRSHRKKGGAVRRHRVKHARKHRGKGAVSDFVGRIPLLGSILGPITSAIGLGLTSPNNNWYLRQHSGGMLSRSAIMINRPNPMMMVKYPSHADMAQAVKIARAGSGVHRRGHYRYVNGKRVHVSGSGIYAPRKTSKYAAKRVHKRRGGAVKRRKTQRKHRGGYAIFPWTNNVAKIAYRH